MMGISRKFDTQAHIDSILDKIYENGIESLTPQEKSFLDNPSDGTTMMVKELDRASEWFEGCFKRLKLRKHRFGDGRSVVNFQTITGRVVMAVTQLKDGNYHLYVHPDVLSRFAGYMKLKYDEIIDYFGAYVSARYNYNVKKVSEMQ